MTTTDSDLLSSTHKHESHSHSEALSYLRVEFDVSWRHLGGLEDKRLKLYVGFCVYIGLLTLAVATLTSRASGGDHDRLGAQILLAMALTIISFACRHIARSERQATERYRNKINLLRRTLLEMLNSPELRAMQIEGNANALQVTSNSPKELHFVDLFDRKRWNTALFMKVTYDIGLAVGVAIMVWLPLRSAIG